MCFIGASEASPFLVMNVAILSVCVCVCVLDQHDICFFVLFTNFYVKAAHGHKSYLHSDKTQRLLRLQARLQQVRAAQMGTF